MSKKRNKMSQKERGLNKRILEDSIGLMGQVQATFFKSDVPNEPGSRGLDNPTGEVDSGDGLIEPPYDLQTLSRMREQSNALNPMVDAYKTNIAGFGYKLQYNIDMNSEEIDESIKTKAKEDWDKLANFYQYCNFDKSFGEIIQEVIGDREYIGFGIMEILENFKGEPVGFEYLPAHTFKIGKLDPNPQEVTLETISPDGKSISLTFMRRFRKFRQEVDNEVVWFKEFGDPRKMDKTTGEFERVADPENNIEAFEVAPDNQAAAVIMFPIHTPYSVYGMPRWIGNLVDMQGSRRASELNYRYFQKGRHVPLAILVKNGTLTESSNHVIQEHVNNVQGVEGAFGYLVLEVTGFEEDEEDLTNSKPAKTDIDIKPLIDTLQTDGLFQEYDQSNRDKLREAMRLAPIYTGASKDYTRATADVAKSITEEQVFQPERRRIAERINRLVNQALGVRYVDMVLNGPDITNKRDLAETVGIYSKMGAITPNMVNQLVSNLIGVEFEPIKADWADLPLQVVLELVKQGQIKINTTDGEPVNPGSSPGTEDESNQGDSDSESTEEETDETTDEPTEEPPIETPSE